MTFNRPRPFGSQKEKKVRALLITTSLASLVAFSATAEDAFTSTVSINSGTVLAPSGMSSSAVLGVSGFGAGGVVVSNSGLNIELVPFSAAGFEGSYTDSEIVVTNTRSVEVSGVLSGIGRVEGTGTTKSIFDAQMIGGASTESAYDLDDSYSSSVTGLARVAGESSSSASMGMIGETQSFIGQLGTKVGGNYSVFAGFGADAGIEYGEGYGFGTYGASGIFIDAISDDINLAIANLGGGTMVLGATNSDVFEGATLLTADASANLDCFLCGSILP
jgi:hypothetical protein